MLPSIPSIPSNQDFCPYVTDEETEAQRKSATCPRPRESETNYEPSVVHGTYTASHTHPRRVCRAFPAAATVSPRLSFTLALQAVNHCPPKGGLCSPVQLHLTLLRSADTVFSPG